MRTSEIIDPAFSPLSWDAELLYWRGEIRTPDATVVDLVVHSLGYLTQLPPFEDATWDRTITPESRQALPRIECADAELRIAVAKEYLPHYPKWNGDELVSAAEFELRLQLEAIHLMPDGSTEAFFADDGMFAGHALIAHVDPDGTVSTVELFG